MKNLVQNMFKLVFNSESDYYVHEGNRAKKASREGSLTELTTYVKKAVTSFLSGETSVVI